MSAASMHIGCTDSTPSRRTGGGDDSVSSLLCRVEGLETDLRMRAMQAECDAANIKLQAERIAALEAALATEQARGEKHAEALMQIARTCESRVDEMQAQHASALTANQRTVTRLEAEKAGLKAANEALQAQVAVLQSQMTCNLKDIHNVVAALHTVLVPLPPKLLTLSPMVFDRAWCAAACGTNWKVEIDATGTRAHVTHTGDSVCVPLRSAAPLLRRHSTLVAGRRQHHLPAYRVVIESYDGDDFPMMLVGFVPSHNMSLVLDAAGIAERPIWDYGGWGFVASPDVRDDDDRLLPGWRAMQPLVGHAAGDAADADASAYATTTKIPPVAAGSAVEFAVDYAAGTCRVAFYTPAAEAGEFAETPYAKLELRFVATEANNAFFVDSPALPVPTLADSGMELYPAAVAFRPGGILRFVL